VTDEWGKEKQPVNGERVPRIPNQTNPPWNWVRGAVEGKLGLMDFAFS